jgi:hypothetical protein
MHNMAYKSAWPIKVCAEMRVRSVTVFLADKLLLQLIKLSRTSETFKTQAMAIINRMEVIYSYQLTSILVPNPPPPSFAHYRTVVVHYRHCVYSVTTTRCLSTSCNSTDRRALQ